MRVKIEVDIGNALKGLLRQQNIVRKKLTSGIMRAGWFVQREAQKRTPVDTGILRSSAHTVQMHTVTLVRAEIRYANVWYAGIVHENIHKNVPRKGGVGEPFFLRNALFENTARIKEIIMESMR